MQMKTSLAVAVIGCFSLAACTDPAQVSVDQNRTQSGALFGAGAGAVAGQIIGGSTKATLFGAALGAGVGAAIGNNLAQQEAELRRDLDYEDVEITNTGESLIVTLPQYLLFESSSATVRSELQQDLFTVAGTLQQFPQSSIQVIGHTDSSGDADYNQRLSERRANAVSSVLINAGVSTDRIQPVGRGENEPVASNLDEAGRAKNRRVEIVIIPTA